MKGQSSIEFLSLVSLSAIVLAGLYGFIGSKQAALGDYNSRKTAVETAEKVSFELEMALLQGEGYSRIFSIDENIAARKYNVSVGKGSSVVEYGNETVSRSSRYNGDWINLSTKESNVYRVLNNGSVHVIEE